MAVVTVSEMDAATASRGIQIADELGRPSTYDSLYVALAEREDCELWTADERYWNAARAQFPRVRWIGDEARGV
jgi:predicted nucleic acid-binding protein